MMDGVTMQFLSAFAIACPIGPDGVISQHRGEKGRLIGFARHEKRGIIRRRHIRLMARFIERRGELLMR